MFNKLIWYAYQQFHSGRLFKIKRRWITYIHRIKLKSCGEQVTIHPNVEIRGHQNIEISDHVSINHNSELYGGGGIYIGKGTMLSYYVTILSDSRTFMGEEPLKAATRKGQRVYKKTTIGRDVWIGTRAIILPGVTVHDHAIVAAGSVVTKDVQSWDIVAGNPAKVVGNRLSEKQV